MENLLGIVTGSISGIRTDAWTVIAGVIGLIVLVLGIRGIVLAVQTVMSGGSKDDN